MRTLCGAYPSVQARMSSHVLTKLNRRPQVATSGADEHIAVLDVETGHELVVLDDALDGRGLTIKFSFDATRLEIGTSLPVSRLS